jgi:hypothetical protein
MVSGGKIYNTGNSHVLFSLQSLSRLFCSFPDTPLCIVHSFSIQVSKAHLLLSNDYHPKLPGSPENKMPEAETKAQFHIAIVGAGLGGLAAAISIAQGGHRATIFEQAAELGEASIASSPHPLSH